MPLTYRATFDTDTYRLRDYLKPGFVVEVRRSSKRSTLEVTERFLSELATYIPQGIKAVARLEVSDSRGYVTQIARYSGRGTARRAYNEPCCAGTWTLEEWRNPGDGSSEDGFPDFVKAGRPPDPNETLTTWIE